MAEIVLISNPSEVCAGTRGSSLGMDALRVADWKLKKSLLNRVPFLRVEDNNLALYKEDPNPHAHRIASITEVFKRTGTLMEPVLKEGKFPLMVGGDHSVAAATIAGLKKAFPNKRLGVVWIDAHADMHTPYTSPSGNIHGMPLAISLGQDNLEEKSNEPVPQTIEEWDALKGLWDIVPKVLPTDIVMFGVRSTERQENALMERLQVRNFMVEEVRQNGLAGCLQETHQRLAHCDMVYVSFDVDSMDPELTSHGTGTPVKHGFSPDEATEIIQGCFEKLPVACFEIVEINPTLDEKGNAMAEISLGILEKVFSFIESHQAPQKSK